MSTIDTPHVDTGDRKQKETFRGGLSGLLAYVIGFLTEHRRRATSDADEPATEEPLTLDDVRSAVAELDSLATSVTEVTPPHSAHPDVVTQASGWAVVSTMGHGREIGWLAQAEVAGQRMVRLDPQAAIYYATRLGEFGDRYGDEAMDDVIAKSGAERPQDPTAEEEPEEGQALYRAVVDSADFRLVIRWKNLPGPIKQQLAAAEKALREYDDIPF